MDNNFLKQLLREKRVFPLVGEINKNTAEELRGNIAVASLVDPQKEIYIVFDSGGGNIEPSLHTYDLIKSVSNPVIGIVNGRCHSSALTIYCACTKRLSLPHSSFFFHAIETGANMKSTDDEEMAMIEFKKVQKYFIESTTNVYVKNFNLAKEKVNELCLIGEKYRRYLTTTEAKELGVVQEIIEKLPF